MNGRLASGWSFETSTSNSSRNSGVVANRRSRTGEVIKARSSLPLSSAVSGRDVASTSILTSTDGHVLPNSWSAPGSQW